MMEKSIEKFIDTQCFLYGDFRYTSLKMYKRGNYFEAKKKFYDVMWTWCVQERIPIVGCLGFGRSWIIILNCVSRIKEIDRENRYAQRCTK